MYYGSSDMKYFPVNVYFVADVVHSYLFWAAVSALWLFDEKILKRL